MAGYASEMTHNSRSFPGLGHNLGRASNGERVTGMARRTIPRGLFERTMKHLRLMLLGTALAAAAAAPTAMAGLGGGIYPTPTPSRGGALSSCPNVAGLRSFSKSAVIAARAEVMRYGRIDMPDDLAASDLSWQPSVRAMWRDRHFKPGHGPQFVLGPSPGTPVTDGSYGIIVRRSCGAKILSRTLEFTSVPGHRSHPPTCDACRTTFFTIDRDGHPLIYFVN